MMRTSGVMILWPLWLRHRLGLSLALAGLLASMLTAWLLAAHHVSSPNVLFLVVAPVVVAGGYFVKVFSFASDAQLEATQSCFPARLWSLPVAASSLAGWPMLAGTLSLTLIWVIVAAGILRPWGLEVPVLWPALFLGAVLAWLQAFLWWSFALPWLRLWVLLALGMGMVAALTGLLAIFEDNGTLEHHLLTALTAGALALAYPVAVAGVAHARRGGATRWEARFPFRWPGFLSVWSGKHFSRAEQAQLWIEWRRAGWSLPIFSLTCALLLLPMTGHSAALLDDMAQSGLSPFGPHLLRALSLFPVLLTVLLPLGFAPGLGSEMGRMSLKRGKEPSSFFLARPLSSAALLRTKALAAALSVLTTHLVLLVVLTCWLGLASSLAAVQEAFHSLGQFLSPAQQVGLMLLFVLAFPLLTWLHMSAGLWSGLLGHSWAAVGNGLNMLTGMSLGVVAVRAGGSPGLQRTLLSLLPWLALGAAASKLVAVVVVCQLVRRRQVLSGPGLLALGAVWMALATAVSAFFLSFAPLTATTVALLVLGLVLFVPLARPLLAPLALDWSRHR